MNFVPYPRSDKNDHADLNRWRVNATKRSGDWKVLKNYLSENCRLEEVHPITKCWYSELQQGDVYALDVEHFRPKAKANPLTESVILELEKVLGFPILQDLKTNYKYPWLEFDYRNYRIVTAKTNRGGAKHTYFPIFNKTKRLNKGDYPWDVIEYPILLDPVNKHDASLMIVQPDGRIIPKSPKTSLTQQHIDLLPLGWTSDPFNYLRAVVSIKVYRLNDTIFIQGRKETYDKLKEEIDVLIIAINHNIFDIVNKSVKKIATCILPSAQFSLSAICSLIDYIPDDKYTGNTIKVFDFIRNKLILSLDYKLVNCKISWDNP